MGNLSVAPIAGSQKFRVQTSATLRPAADEFVTYNWLGLTAVAQAQPQPCSSRITTREFSYGESAKAPADHLADLFCGWSPWLNWIAPILCLLKLIGPSTIIRFVVAIAIDAVNGHSRWPRAHIGEKVAEIIPSLADLNPSCAVTTISCNAWIAASVKHIRPCAVFWRRISNWCVAVFVVISWHLPLVVQEGY